MTRLRLKTGIQYQILSQRTNADRDWLVEIRLVPGTGTGDGPGRTPFLFARSQARTRRLGPGP